MCREIVKPENPSYALLSRDRLTDVMLTVAFFVLCLVLVFLSLS